MTVKKTKPSWRTVYDRLNQGLWTLRPGFLRNRLWGGVFIAYVALLSVTSLFYLRRDVMGLQAGDLVLMDIYAPFDLRAPLSRFSEEDLGRLQHTGTGEVRRVKGVRNLALSGLNEAFRVVEEAAERAESAGLVRVHSPFLPTTFPLERLLALPAKDRLNIRWAAHSGLTALYEKGLPMAQSAENLKKRFEKTGVFGDLRGEKKRLALESAAAFALPDAHQDLLSTLQSLRARGKGPSRAYQAGERLLRAGQQLTQDDVALLQQAPREVSNQLAWRLVLLGVLLLVILLLFVKLVEMLDANLLKTNAFFWVATVTGLLLFASVPVAMKIKLAYMGYALTGLLVFNALLVSALYRPPIAGLVVLFQVVLLGTVFLIPPRFLLPAFVVSVMALVYFKSRFTREDLLRLGAVCAVLAGLLALATEVSYSKPMEEALRAMVVAVASTLIGAVVALGSLPLFEKLFNIATANTLLELANPNHPLLRKLFVEAPGTYHHSMIMAAISDAAVEALGGDALLARVACYYHDIGKTRRPEFFTENLNPGEASVHDDLAPSLSALVIVNHVKEGIEMGRAARLPESIIRVIPAHHGTGLVSFFYNKAKIQAQGETVNESQFRYPGPKPQTMEEAVIMLADTCEASVRSLPTVTLKAVEDQVDRMIKGKLEDGQLDDCSLTLQQLDVIRQVFVKTLLRIHHQRLNYEKGLQAELTKTKAREGKSAGARPA